MYVRMAFIRYVVNRDNQCHQISGC